MKKLAIMIMVVGCFLATSTLAQASVTFIFDPNNLVNLWEQGPPLGTPDPANPRAVYTGGVGTIYPAYTGIGNWNTAGYGSPLDVAIKNDYLKWRDTDGGYLRLFNIWLADNPRARGWGETLVTDGSPVSGTAGAGWVTKLYNLADLGWGTGYILEWYTDDPSDPNLEKGGVDFPQFSFSANVFVDTDEDGYDADDPGAVIGNDYTIWFGAYAGNETYKTSDGEILWQGTLDLTAVPEPTTMLLLGIGLLGLAGRRIRKRFKK